MEDVNQAWETFYSILYNLINKYVPLSCDTKHKFKISAQEIQIIKKKHRLWTRFMENQTAENRLNYNRARNKVKKISRHARNNFENSLATNAKNNPKAIWKYVNSKNKTSSNISCINSSNGEKLTNDHMIAETFNKFFACILYITFLSVPW